jgi:hypothetical protein
VYDASSNTPYRPTIYEHLAAANVCWLCANDSSRSIQSIWGIRKLQLNQPNQPQSQSCTSNLLRLENRSKLEEFPLYIIL